MSEFLEIVRASTHNLKDCSVTLPKNKLIVITWVSGSGKSSLAFDTIFSEGQRRYLESLSTYARMIISSINEDARVEEIRGLSPTVSIHQKTVSSNPRSTVGTITEIYDFYRLLYTTIGHGYCPRHPSRALESTSVSTIIDALLARPNEEKFHILAPLNNPNHGSLEELSKYILESWFVRFQIDHHVWSVSDDITGPVPKHKIKAIVIDRLVKKNTSEDLSVIGRLRDSLELAYKTGSDRLVLYFPDRKKSEAFEYYSRKAACPQCDFSLEPLTLSHFSFNSHYGACEHCHGLGIESVFLEEKITNPALSIAEGAILPWTQHGYYITILEAVCKKYNIDLHCPYGTLSEKDRNAILHGVPETFTIEYDFTDGIKKKHSVRYEWVITNLQRRYFEQDDHNEHFTKRVAPYVTEIECHACDGCRLKKDPLLIRIKDKNIGALARLCVRDALIFFRSLKLNQEEQSIAKNILKNILERLEFLEGVGLSYVTIDRRATTLSGWESQRIRLATQIGTKLEGIIYILDEPSIGLHPRDNVMLISNIRKLVNLGNTVIVVEHDPEIMRHADHILDIGPDAGKRGGAIVFSGTYDKILKDKGSITGAYLSGKKEVSVTPKKRRISEKICIRGAEENNLKKVDVDIPLWVFSVITGISGSGKSSLIMDTLANAALRHFSGTNVTIGKVKRITGFEHLDKAIVIDQSPIGRTPHSNIATYTGVFSAIREVFSTSLEAKKRWYGPGRFSFNTRGGRCESCEGSGVKKIEMHFLPDVYVECETCKGSRYNRETLEVQYRGKNISDILHMTVEEARTFFKSHPKIERVLSTLTEVWLGYIELGQSAPTLSWGESQRIKLAFDLSRRSTSKTLYVLDEPSTGLHFSDIQKLLDILHRLVDKGNTVIVIEHNLDIIATADYIIDVGPEWGSAGGTIVYAGPLEKIIHTRASFTGQFLKPVLERKLAFSRKKL